MNTTKPTIAGNGPGPNRSSYGPTGEQSLDWKPPGSWNGAAAAARAIMQAAQVHYQKQHLDAARDFLNLLEPLAAHTADSLETLGNLNFLLGEFKPAVAAYQRGLELEPRRAALWIRLALTCQRLKDAAGAQRGLERALALEPANPDGLKLLADNYLAAGRYQDAAITYGKLIGRHPQQAGLFLLLAKCFFQIGNRAATFAALQHVLDIEPGNRAAKDNLQALSRQGPAQSPAQPKARTDGRNGAGLPAAAQERLARADAAYANGHLPAACEFIQQALRHAPQSVALQVCLGNLQFQLDDFGAAFESYRKACAVEPGNVDSLVRLAATSLRVNQVGTFEQSLGRALELDPQNAEALRLLADTNYSAGRFRDAAGQYSTLLDQAPNDAELLLLLGNCGYRLNDLAMARQCFERVLDINPVHGIAQENLQAVMDRLNAAPAKVAPGSGWSIKPAGPVRAKGQLSPAVAAA